MKNVMAVKLISGLLHEPSLRFKYDQPTTVADRDDGATLVPSRSHPRAFPQQRDQIHCRTAVLFTSKYSHTEMESLNLRDPRIPDKEKRPLRVMSLLGMAPAWLGNHSNSSSLGQLAL